MADVSSEISLDFFKLKVTDLKEELKLSGLSTTENKTELLKSLPISLKSIDVAGSEYVDDLEEDLLNDDGDKHLIENGSAILENELNVLLKPSKIKLIDTVDDTSSIEEHPEEVILNGNESAISENALNESLKPLKRKLIETVDDKSSIEEPPKKVILTTNEDINDETVTSETKPGEKKSVEIDERKEEKKVIKLSQFSGKGRLEMRAKKFGVISLNPDAMEAVRAERFEKSNGNNSATSNTSSNVITSVDKLKQRAIRFGGSVSTVMSNLENWEKLGKRKARFGASANRVVPESEKAIHRLSDFIWFLLNVLYTILYKSFENFGLFPI